MSADKRTVELSESEFALLLKYGYLLPEAAEALRDSPTQDGWRILTVDSYNLSM